MEIQTWEKQRGQKKVASPSLEQCSAYSCNWSDEFTEWYTAITDLTFSLILNVLNVHIPFCSISCFLLIHVRDAEILCYVQNILFFFFFTGV